MADVNIAGDCIGCQDTMRRLDKVLEFATNFQVEMSGEGRDTAQLHVLAAVCSWWVDRTLKAIPNREQAIKAIGSCLASVFEEQGLPEQKYGREVTPEDVRAFQKLLAAGLFHRRQEGQDIQDGLSVQNMPDDHTVAASVYLKLDTIKVSLSLNRDGSADLFVVDLFVKKPLAVVDRPVPNVGVTGGH